MRMMAELVQSGDGTLQEIYEEEMSMIEELFTFINDERFSERDEEEEEEKSTQRSEGSRHESYYESDESDTSAFPKSKDDLHPINTGST